jgi:hypothetical protein
MVGLSGTVGLGILSTRGGVCHMSGVTLWSLANRELLRVNLLILENPPPPGAWFAGASLDWRGFWRAVQISQNDNYKTAGRRLRDVHVRSPDFPDPHV